MKTRSLSRMLFGILLLLLLPGAGMAMPQFQPQSGAAPPPSRMDAPRGPNPRNWEMYKRGEQGNADLEDVEGVVARTATSATYRLDDGRYATVMTTHPLNYRDDEGQWQPIDPRFTKSERGWMNLRNDVKTSLALESSRAKVWAGPNGVGWEPQKLVAASSAGAGRILMRCRPGPWESGEWDERLGRADIIKISGTNGVKTVFGTFI